MKTTSAKPELFARDMQRNVIIEPFLATVWALYILSEQHVKTFFNTSENSKNFKKIKKARKLRNYIYLSGLSD